MNHRRTSLLVLAGLLSISTGAASAQPVTVTDMMGRDITLAKPAERIVSFPIPLASTIISLDMSARRLVGMNATAKSAMAEGIFGVMFPDALRTPDNMIGARFVPNVEALVATQPDLVIQWGDVGDQVVKPLLNAGLTAMLVTFGDEQKARAFMDITAKAMGRNDRIAPFIDWRIRVRAEIEAKTSAILPEKRPSVLHLARALDNLQVDGSGPSYMDFQIRLAGGRNAAAELSGWSKPVNKEQIAAWDPEVITLNSFEPKLTKEFILNDPVLSQTRAAKSGRIYKMPMGGYRWDPPSQDSPLAWMWLANLLHPEIFKFDLRTEMTRAFQLLYGYTLKPDEIDRILWMDVQGSATNYAVFKASAPK